MGSGVLVLVEHRDGRIKQASLEALGEGRRQRAAGTAPLTALVLGSDVSGVAAEIARHGCDRVLSVDQGFFAKYDCAAFGKALAEVVAEIKPALVLLAATTMGRDLGPYAAAKLDCGYAADCIALVKDGGRVSARRPVYAGKAIATVRTDHEPFVCSLRPKAFEAAPDGAGAPAPIEMFTPRAEPDLVKAIARSIVRNDTGKLDVGEADIIVSGGRGLGGPEGFKPIEDLATVLGAAVGASRAVVDLGWREHAAQVGQTGKTVSPTLYIACGISGAIQHLAGMRTSKVIVAINRDPDAPIFKVATYGIVGDVFEVVPVLTEAFREALASCAPLSAGPPASAGIFFSETQMSTTVTVQCPSCQASYQAPVERAGAHFKCKKCNQILTVPGAGVELDLEPMAERPVVMPSTPARPVVAPSTAPRPVVMPAAPAAAQPPRQRPAPRASRSALPPVPEPGGTAVKSRTTLVLVVVGLLVAICVGGYFAWPKGDTNQGGPKPAGPGAVVQDPGQPKAPVFDAAKRAKELRAETGSDSAGQMWSLAQKLDAETKIWREKGAPAEAAADLEVERDGVLEKLVALSPDHAEGRAMRGEMKYEKDLDPYFDATYLSDSERDLVRKNRLLVNLKAGENAGWIPKTTFESQVKPLVEKFSVAQAAAEALAASPFGKSAKNLEGSVLGDLTTRLGGKASFRAFIHEPYLIFVEEDLSWSPQLEAKTLFGPLKAVHEAFLKEFGGLGLKQLDEPVPVMLFKSKEQYHAYNKAIGHDSQNVLAHYEPGTGRLALNKEVTHEVTIHEGTHQLFDRYTSAKLPWLRQAYWFSEEIAEWFGGSNRVQAKDGSWAYETGVLLEKRLDGWRDTAEDKWFKLDELLDQTYAKKQEYEAMGGAGQVKIGLLYAQGWFLIYFLNHFVVDDAGMVKIGSKGKYADGWSEYLKAELTGRSGKKMLKESLKLDDAGFAKLEDEYFKYFRFVQKKRNLGQAKEKKLVPWDQWVNKKGEKAGEKEDDLLIDPKRPK